MIFNENGEIINEGFMDRLRDSFKSPAQKRKEAMIKSEENRAQILQKYKSNNSYANNNNISLSEDEIDILVNEIDKTCKKLSKMKLKVTTLVKKIYNKYNIPEKFIDIDCDGVDSNGDPITIDDYLFNIKYCLKNNIDSCFINFRVTCVDDVKICKYFEDNGINVPMERNNNPAVNAAYEIAKELKSISGIPSYYSFDWEDDKPIGIQLCCDLNQMIKTLINK